MNKRLCCLILAAGEGTRMNTDIPKVLCEVLFKPMISWVLDSVISCDIKDTCVITGYKRQILENYLKAQKYDVKYVYQKERKGTAHAVMMATDFLNEHIDDDILILGGDSPFIDKKTLLESYDLHSKNGNSATIVTSCLENPYGYGRIVRDTLDNSILSIVEEKDASEHQKNIKEVNSGVYWFKVRDLKEYLGTISENNVQREYYLTSIIKIFISQNLKVETYESSFSNIVLGANNRLQLQSLNNIAKEKIICDYLKEGLNIPYTDGVVIGSDVKIGSGTTILPNTLIYGNTHIGNDCIIGPCCEIINCNIEDKCEIKFGFWKDKTIIKGSRKIFPSQ